MWMERLIQNLMSLENWNKLNILKETWIHLCGNVLSLLTLILALSSFPLFI